MQNLKCMGNQVPSAGAFGARLGTTASGGGTIPRESRISLATVRPYSAGADGTCHPDSVSAPSEGVDGTEVAFLERLNPPWWVWFVGALLGAPLAVAYGAAFGLASGWLVFGAYLVILCTTLITTSPVICVDDLVLRAGRARLPLQFVGTVSALDTDHMTNARGINGNRAAFLLTRNWCSHTGVLIEVTDETDPHPYWLVTSRNPEALVAALHRSVAIPRRVEYRPDHEEQP
ncbi:MAG: DUF3093 family protein [Actinobacteria bacterium]|nr:DUF3093 family protein [Actinomycetota bacterium]